MCLKIDPSVSKISLPLQCWGNFISDRIIIWRLQFKYIYMLIFISMYRVKINGLSIFKYIYMLIFIRSPLLYLLHILQFKYIYMLIFINTISSL